MPSKPTPDDTWSPDQAGSRADIEEVTGPTPVRRIRLATVDELRVELAAVYRDMRARRIPTSDGTRLAYVLGEMRKALETINEDRLEALEELLRQKGITHVP